MDLDLAIERNGEALKRVLAMLVAMAAFPVWRAGNEAGIANLRPTLPRHLHRAVLRLLRPAESAVRRLIIVAARGLAASPRLSSGDTSAPRRSRPRNPEPKQSVLRSRVGTGILMPSCLRPDADRQPLPPRKCALPLFDRLRRTGGRKRKAARGMPRICVPGLSAPVPVRPPPAPDDRIDAVRLALRLDALGRALNDLPREAERFARWRMRRDAERAQPSNHDGEVARKAQASRAGRVRRLWPLRMGRPPGSRRRPFHEVHDILSETHALAFEVLESADTS